MIEKSTITSFIVFNQRIMENRDFFNFSQSIPNQVFKNPKDLLFHFYNYDALFAQPYFFFKCLKQFLEKKEANTLTITSKFEVNSIENNQTQEFSINQIDDYFYSYLYLHPNENEDILTFSNKVYISDNMNDWGLIFEHNTELMIIGINPVLDSIYRSIFFNEPLIESQRYQSLSDVINSNFAFSNQNHKYLIEILSKNYAV